MPYLEVRVDTLSSSAFIMRQLDVPSTIFLEKTPHFFSFSGLLTLLCQAISREIRSIFNQMQSKAEQSHHFIDITLLFQYFPSLQTVINLNTVHNNSITIIIGLEHGLSVPHNFISDRVVTSTCRKEHMSVPAINIFAKI